MAFDATVRRASRADYFGGPLAALAAPQRRAYCVLRQLAVFAVTEKWGLMIDGLDGCVAFPSFTGPPFEGPGRRQEPKWFRG